MNGVSVTRIRNLDFKSIDKKLASLCIAMRVTKRGVLFYPVLNQHEIAPDPPKPDSLLHYLDAETLTSITSGAITEHIYGMPDTTCSALRKIISLENVFKISIYDTKIIVSVVNASTIKNSVYHLKRSGKLSVRRPRPAFSADTKFKRVGMFKRVYYKKHK